MLADYAPAGLRKNSSTTFENDPLKQILKSLKNPFLWKVFPRGLHF